MSDTGTFTIFLVENKEKKMSEFKPQAAPPTMMDDYKLSLQGDKQNGSKGAPSFKLRVVNGNPRAFVYPNIEGDEKPLTGNMDQVMFSLYMQMFDEVFKTEGKCRFDLELKDKPWDGNANKRSENFIIIGTLSVGRDDDGMIYTCLIANNRPKCKFPFKPPYLCDVRKANGETVSDAIKSELAARAWKKLTERSVTQLMVSNYKPREKKQPQGGGGNWNKNGGGRQSANTGGGGWNAKKDLGDDINF